MLRNVQKVIKMAKKSKQVLERIENFERIIKSYQVQGYTYQKVKINIVTANIVACVIMVAVAVMGIVLMVKGIDLYIPLWLFLLMLLSVIIHELLHGIAWSIFCSKKWKSIQFGIIWKMITPYCSCLEPLSWIPYLIGGLIPCLILGIIPYIFAIIWGNTFVLWFAVFNIAAASGDLMVAYHICKDRPSLVMDLPEECGYISIYQA